MLDDWFDSLSDDVRTMVLVLDKRVRKLMVSTKFEDTVEAHHLFPDGDGSDDAVDRVILKLLMNELEPYLHALSVEQLVYACSLDIPGEYLPPGKEIVAWACGKELARRRAYE